MGNYKVGMRVRTKEGYEVEILEITRERDNQFWVSIPPMHSRIIVRILADYGDVKKDTIRDYHPGDLDKRIEHYFLRADWQDDWQEVSVEQFITAERSAGFGSRFSDRLATGGFSGRGINGRIEIEYIGEVKDEH